MLGGVQQKKTVTGPTDDLWESVWADSATEENAAAAEPFEYNSPVLVTARTSDRAGRAPTRPLCDTRPMGGWASFSFFCSGRAGGRRLKIHAGPGGWAVDFSTGRPWASPGF